MAPRPTESTMLTNNAASPNTLLTDHVFRDIQKWILHAGAGLAAIKSPQTEYEQDVAKVQALLNDNWKRLYAAADPHKRATIQNEIVQYGRELQLLEFKYKSGLELATSKATTQLNDLFSPGVVRKLEASPISPSNFQDHDKEWPFNPSAAFQKRRMEVSYTVEPRQKWLGLRRYNSFILNHVKYRKEDFVYIANSATVERQNAVKVDPGQAVRPQPADHWVAKILEIRAADEHHVYARIYWMYSPNDLPPDTVASGKLASEQQTQHNQQELVASNHKHLVDIINVASVVRPATVKHPVDREDMQDAGVIYWRQAFDYITSELFIEDLKHVRLIASNERHQ
ncbi:hypothetical protein O9K51_09481 [Purpureocillium lavendulum]|uniref:BAH domain-containing protein n=1 Tax=Purpureocillium lavendulum TaxID=1247861 RepID=A0AB34FG98_9HYPO|nr:hypothetical protein O9K51_09481 [Purpureocillium lavendulum]